MPTRIGPSEFPTIRTRMKNGVQYYRISVKDVFGKRIEVSGKSEEEVLKKYRKVEREKNSRLNPTVAEYCEKWLYMQSANLQANTLRRYTDNMLKYIVEPLGDKYMSEVTADDLKMIMIPVSEKSVSTFDTVHMLIKSI